MALISPGVQVTVVDESDYVSTAVGTIPYILLVTAQDKQSGAGVGIASGTTLATANQVNLITSQRDLLAKYGTPTFYEDGSEINEYGLLAAYSALGQSSLCYVQRANVDLSVLKGSLSRPTGKPIDGKYYIDVVNSRWGFNVWNGLTSSFTYVKPSVITDPSLIDSITGAPIPGYGAAGDIAIVATNGFFPAYQKMRVGTIPDNSQAITKTLNNTWQLIGSVNWSACIPWSTSYPNADIFASGNATINSQTTYQAILATSLNDFATQYQPNLNSSFANAAAVGTTYDSTTGKTVLQWYVDSSAIPDNFASIPYHYVIWEATPQSGVPYGYVDQPSGGDVANAFNMVVYQPSPSYQYPAWNLPSLTGQTDTAAVTNGPSSPTGSIWQNVSDEANGSLLIVKQYNATSNTFATIPAPFYYNAAGADYAYDPTGGGYNIPVGTLYTQYDAQDDLSYPSWPNPKITNRNPVVAPQRNPKHAIFRRYSTGITQVTGTVSSPTFTGLTFTVGSSNAGSAEVTYEAGFVTIPNGATAQQFIAAFSSIAPSNCVASLNSKNQLVITHLQGGSVYLIENNQGSGLPPVYPTHNAILTFAQQAGFTETHEGVYWKYAAQKIVTNAPSGNSIYTPAYVEFSNWNMITAGNYGFYQNGIASDSSLANDTVWYWNDPTQVDIMIQNGGAWKGYRTVTNSIRGENLTLTDPNGPIFSTTAPTVQSTGSALVAGDLWIDTSDLDNYPKLYRWTTAPITGYKTWQPVDVNNKYTTSGVLFADARWANAGNVNPATGNIVPISAMLTSNYLDIDAPNPALYPQGVLLWNTRRSGYDVKQYKSNYFTAQNFPGKSLPAQPATWLTISGSKPSGAAALGRQAQRSVIVKALRSAVDSSDSLREENKAFTLLACPQYPELAPNLVALNNEREDTGFILVDTPLRLSPDNIVTWATNNNGTGTSTGDGLLVGDPYTAAFYPSCQTTDLTGNTVVTCSTHMMLRTILSSDAQSYLWFAPAGNPRGKVDNALQIGYLNASSSTFTALGVNQGIRDVLYSNRIDPITFIPGTGIVNYGNKTTTGITSALDRINVARLVAYVRGRVKSIANQYLFEPNDQITRNSITNALNGLMIDLISKRALYDYLVVCDASNNTPDRIDRNELWVDIAIEPVKAIEFIYIPIRIKNTGAISEGL